MANRSKNMKQAQDPKSEDENINAGILGGLSLIMGSCLTIEAVAYLLIADSFDILILFNAIQGIIVFILFVLNQRVRHLIKERYGFIRNKLTEFEVSIRNCLLMK